MNTNYSYILYSVQCISTNYQKLLFRFDELKYTHDLLHAMEEFVFYN
jgi:hypothetical protein